MNTARVCACAAALAFLASGALGNTIIHDLSMPAFEQISSEGYGGTLEVPQFDPSWGILSSVTIDVVVRFDGAMTIENQDPERSVIARGQMDWHFELLPPAGQATPSVLISAYRVAQFTLDPYEEGNDYCQAHVVLTAQDTQQTVVTLRSNDMLPFTGGGMLSLPIAATFTPSATALNPADADVVVAEGSAEGSFRADYTVSYQYVVPEPVALGVLIAGGLLLRRR